MFAFNCITPDILLANKARQILHPPGCCLQKNMLLLCAVFPDSGTILLFLPGTGISTINLLLFSRFIKYLSFSSLRLYSRYTFSLTLTGFPSI